jgi:CRP-like cAMP-binding protein
MVTTVRFQRGQVILREGDRSTEAYIIRRGRVEVTKAGRAGPVALATLGEGEIFGEMALITEKPRSATVTALEEVEAAVVDPEGFNRLLREQPEFLFPILRVLFERLRAASEALAAREAAAPAITGQAAASGPAVQGPAAGPARPERIILSGATREARLALGGRALEVQTMPFRIGRQDQMGEDDVLSLNDLSIADRPPYSVARNHCMLSRIEDELVVVDRGSATGTLVNGKRIGGDRSRGRAALTAGENELVLGTASSPYKFSVGWRVG